jgi:CheY-like chemotaxis protein
LVVCWKRSWAKNLELVGIASDFGEMVMMLQAGNPDVIVVDLHMTDRPEECRRLKQNRSSLRIVAISAAADDETKSLAERLGGGMHFSTK